MSRGEDVTELADEVAVDCSTLAALVRATLREVTRPGIDVRWSPLRQREEVGGMEGPAKVFVEIVKLADGQRWNQVISAAQSCQRASELADRWLARELVSFVM